MADAGRWYSFEEVAKLQRTAKVEALRERQHYWRELSKDRTASVSTNAIRRVVANKFGDAADEIERGG